MYLCRRAGDAKLNAFGRQHRLDTCTDARMPMIMTFIFTNLGTIAGFCGLNCPTFFWDFGNGATLTGTTIADAKRQVKEFNENEGTVPEKKSSAKKQAKKASKC